MENKSITEMLLQLVCSINREQKLDYNDEAVWVVKLAKKQLETILEYRYESDE